MMTRAISLAALIFACGTIACAQEPPPYVPPNFATSGSATFDAWRQSFAFRAVQIERKDKAIVEANLAGLTPDPAVTRLIDSQPEFVRPVWVYLGNAVVASRIEQGRASLAARRAILEKDAADIGVPAEIAVSIWGMETSYGGNKGSSDVVRSLSSLAAAGRRVPFNEGELLAVFDILKRGEATRPVLIGSWAGAMGHTQFMPSSFLSRAIDGDGDGKRDIWNNPVDALASAMNYLARAGWVRGEPWGLEVSAPAGFDWSLADGTFRTVSDWKALGISAVGGRSLDSLSPTMSARILAPAGAGGATFLLGRNFDAIKSYNNSDSYALAVGLLADQIAGRGRMPTRWPTDNPPLNRSAARELQGLLNGLGFDTGEPDGAFGTRSRRGLQAFQKANGLLADGYGSATALEQVRAAARARGVTWTAPPATSTPTTTTAPTNVVAVPPPAAQTPPLKPRITAPPPSKLDPNYKGPPPVKMTW